MLAFDVSISVWLTQSILLVTDIFCPKFQDDWDGVILQNGETLAY